MLYLESLGAGKSDTLQSKLFGLLGCFVGWYTMIVFEESGPFCHFYVIISEKPYF